VQRNTVAVQVVHDRVFQELLGGEQVVVRHLVEEVVVNALHFAGSAWSGGRRHTVPDRELIYLEPFDQRRLADAGRSGENEYQSAGGCLIGRLVVRHYDL